MNKKSAIQSSQLLQMFAASNISLLTSTVIAIIFAYSQQDVIPATLVFSWLTLVLVSAFLRASLVLIYKTFPVSLLSTPETRLFKYRVGVLLAGMIFGSAGILMFPYNDPQHQMFLVFMLAGLTAGSVVSYSPDLICSIGFSTLSLTPITLRLLASGDNILMSMGMATLVYLCFMIMVIRHTNKNNFDNLSLRHEAVVNEALIRVSEERYRLLLNYSPIGIFHFDKDLIITYCNNRFAEILNSSIARIIGLDMKLLEDKSVLPTLQQSLEGNVRFFEGQYQATFSNSQGWIDMTCAPSRDGAGEIVGGIAIVRDITQQKQSEAAVSAASERLKISLEGSQISTWEIDPLSGEVLLDATWETFLGNPRCETRTTFAKLLEIVHPKDREIVALNGRKIMKGEISSYVVEHRVSAGNGEWIWILSRGRVIEQDTTGKVRRVCGTNTNITAHKKAEQLEQFRSQTLELLTGDNPRRFILEAIVRGVEQLNPTMLCSILLLDKTGTRLTQGIAPSLPDFFNAAIDGVEIGIGVGSCGTAAFTGTRVIVEDIATHPYWAQYTDLAACAHLRACWSQPILSSSDQVLGTFAIYHRHPYSPSTTDISMIEQAAYLASIAIERKLVEEKLQRSEQQYRLLIETANEGILVAQGNNFKLVNQKTLEVTEYSKTELMSLPFLDLIYQDDRALVKNNFMRRMIGEVVDTRYQFRILAKSGLVKWVEMSGAKIEWEDQPASFNFITDITQRKQTEDALRYSEQRFRDVSEAAGEYLWEIDLNLSYTYVSRQSLDVKGYTPNELLGHTPKEFMPVEDISQLEAVINDSIVNKIPFKFQHRDITKSGEIFWEEVNGVPIYSEQGNVIGLRGTGLNITERKKAEEEIHHLAFYDALTKLPNRRMLMDRLISALSISARNNCYGALLFLDMDKFKTINDSLGHDYGDFLLIEVAKRIQFCVREEDTVARIGGDEFVILLEEVDKNPETASQKVALIAEKIRLTLTEPYRLQGIEQHSSPSIGVSLYRGKELSADALLKHADMAMYQAKGSGRNVVHFFNPTMQLSVETRATLEADLRHAVAYQQLFLHYQVQVDNDHLPIGAEALLRWRHPLRGIVSPEQFIPIAEESSLIIEIGGWVLEQACRQLAIWSKSPQTQTLTLAVNVSTQQFKQHDFVGKISKVIAIHNVNPSLLKLELTESVLLNDVTDVVTKMLALKALGVSLSLDDFGTGYSSLSYLKRLPLDQIKIDQSFVRDIAIDQNDAVMVQTIIDLAKNFRLDVIAEGVETELQRGFLAQHGCMAYQGYFFSIPVPIELFEALITPPYPWN